MYRRVSVLLVVLSIFNRRLPSPLESINSPLPAPHDVAPVAATIAIYPQRKLVGKPERTVHLYGGSGFGEIASGARMLGLPNSIVAANRTWSRAAARGALLGHS